MGVRRGKKKIKDGATLIPNCTPYTTGQVEAKVMGTMSCGGFRVALAVKGGGTFKNKRIRLSLEKREVRDAYQNVGV